MQHHILGVGSVGTLIGFHLARSIRRMAQKEPQKAIAGLPAPHAHPFLPPPSSSGITLHLRPPPPQNVTAPNAKGKAKAVDTEAELTVEVEGVKQLEKGFSIERTDAVSDIVKRVAAETPRRWRLKPPPQSSSSILGGVGSGTSSAPIDSLIISTKADSVLSALRSISQRITPDTTIVLATNGALGVLDELNERIFRDPANRPFFLLANNTHGTWSKAPRHTVHAASGEMQLALVPDPAKLQQAGAASSSSWERPLASDAAPAARLARATSPLDLNALPADASIRGTLASLLVLPLSVSWVPWADMRLLQRRKLVVNSCINPLTALLDVRNGALFGRKEADGLIRSVCREAEAVFAAELVRDAETNPSAPTEPFPPALRANALYAEVQRVMQATSPNWSSMHQDMHRRRINGPRRTEVDFINGSLCSLGRRLGTPTPTNDALVDLVKTQAALIDKGAKAWGIV